MYLCNKSTFFYFSRYASAICGISLPQHDYFCKRNRENFLKRKKFKYTLKYDKDQHGFALLNMTQLQLIDVAIKDPFMSQFTIQYLLMLAKAQAVRGAYSLGQIGNEINHMSEYLSM